MKKTAFVMILAGIISSSGLLYAQDETGGLNNTGNATLNLSAETNTAEPFFLDDYKPELRWGTLIGVPAIVVWYGVKAWGWGENRGWQWADEDWFGYNTQHGGVDKLGHVWTHYMLFRTMYNVFDYTENGGFNKWIWSGVLTGAIGTVIEIGDGMTDKYGFSNEDMISDFTGIGIGILLKAVPVVDNFFSYTWGWEPSDPYIKYHAKWQDFTQDYSGHKYIISFKMAGFKKLGWDMPNFLRYINIDFGYYTKNYESYDRKAGIPESEKSRNFMVGVSLNFEEVVADLFDNPESRYCEISQYPFKLIHVPVGYEHEMSIDK